MLGFCVPGHMFTNTWSFLCMVLLKDIYLIYTDYLLASNSVSFMPEWSLFNTCVPWKVHHHLVALWNPSISATCFGDVLFSKITDTKPYNEINKAVNSTETCSHCEWKWEESSLYQPWVRTCSLGGSKSS